MMNDIEKKMLIGLNVKDWLIIHDALCFVHIRKKTFEKFLKERNDNNLLQYWKRNGDESGHLLIGVASTQIDIEKKKLEFKETQK